MNLLIKPLTDDSDFYTPTSIRVPQIVNKIFVLNELYFIAYLTYAGKTVELESCCLSNRGEVSESYRVLQQRTLPEVLLIITSQYLQ